MADAVVANEHEVALPPLSVEAKQFGNAVARSAPIRTTAPNARGGSLPSTGPKTTCPEVWTKRKPLYTTIGVYRGRSSRS